ncbi:MAG: hypothetical protein SXV54_11665 [Chloroflexota bacterium]|nr:hypothetical protein [Chloroflexota bacterium]
MRSHVLIPLIALTVVAQSCCCCTMFGGPQPPHTITPSNEAVQRFRERWATEVGEGIDGFFTITVTDEEMTSLVTQMLAQQEDLPPISDPQVHFRNGRIEVYATVTVADSLPLPGLVAFSATATGDGINVTLEEVAFGPLPIPEPVLETMTETLNESLSQSILVEIGEATITDIQIGTGEMTLSGQIRPE